jgi:hypothetical protein
MTWILHDIFKTKQKAKKFGENVVGVGLAKGIKVVKGKNKLRPYELYILPLKEVKW